MSITLQQAHILRILDMRIENLIGLSIVLWKARDIFKFIVFFAHRAWVSCFPPFYLAVL
jgi:hypothetical protein